MIAWGSAFLAVELQQKPQAVGPGLTPPAPHGTSSNHHTISLAPNFLVKRREPKIDAVLKLYTNEKLKSEKLMGASTRRPPLPRMHP